METKLYTVIGKRWFDKAAGNTYHTARCLRHSDGAVIVAPFQYGYGDHYQQSALKAMHKAGWLPDDYAKKLYLYERENNYPIIWTVSDVTKKECTLNGMEL